MCRTVLQFIICRRRTSRLHRRVDEHGPAYAGADTESVQLQLLRSVYRNTAGSWIHADNRTGGRLRLQHAAGPVPHHSASDNR